MDDLGLKNNLFDYNNQEKMGQKSTQISRIVCFFFITEFKKYPKLHEIGSYFILLIKTKVGSSTYLNFMPNKQLVYS